jgi:hypothetical protein
MVRVRQKRHLASCLPAAAAAKHKASAALRRSNVFYGIAAQYITARSTGAPVLLCAGAMKRVLGKFKTYGKAANPAGKRRAKPST